jgi:S1-C subfamily serine protease
MCSAFFVSPDGYIATANHCITTTGDMEAFYAIDGKMVHVHAKVVAADKPHDVAIIKIDVKDHSYFNINTDPQIGQHTVIWGWPNVYVYGYKLKHYDGKITDIDDNSIYIYSFIAHGMSGGALVNDAGEVLGITSAGEFTLFDKGWTTNGIIAKIQYLQLLMIANNIHPLPSVDFGTPTKMVFLAVEAANLPEDN